MARASPCHGEGRAFESRQPRLNMEGPKKGEKTDHEVLETLRESAGKKPEKDDSGSFLGEEASKAVDKNIKKRGKVWKSDEEGEKDSK